MRRYRISGGCILTSTRSVIATHNALQFGKLTNHPRHQIGLGKQSRTRCNSRIRPRNGGGDISRQLFQSLRLVMHCAKTLIEGNVGKARQEIGKWSAAILNPEKLGICQPGTQHALVAGQNDGITFVICKTVADNNEMR